MLGGPSQPQAPAVGAKEHFDLIRDNGAVLKLHDRGPAVEELNKRLGLTGDTFTEDTWAAVRSLQLTFNLHRDGKFGVNTIHALDSLPEIQKKLGLEESGVFDKNFVDAVKTFQRNHHLKVDGEIGPLTAKALSLVTPPVGLSASLQAELLRIGSEEVKADIKLRGAHESPHRLSVFSDPVPVPPLQMGPPEEATQESKPVAVSNTFSPTLQFPRRIPVNEVANIDSLAANELAEAAENLHGNKLHSQHSCMAGVRLSLQAMPDDLLEWNHSILLARGAIPVLKRDPQFAQVMGSGPGGRLTADELREVAGKAGLVVVYKNPFGADKAGHICITDGRGGAFSDFRQDQGIDVYASHGRAARGYYVFLPIGKQSASAETPDGGQGGSTEQGGAGFSRPLPEEP